MDLFRPLQEPRVPFCSIRSDYLTWYSSASLFCNSLFDVEVFWYVTATRDLRHCHLFTPESTQAVSQVRLLGTFQLICLWPYVFTYVCMNIDVICTSVERKYFPKSCNTECVVLISVMLFSVQDIYRCFRRNEFNNCPTRCNLFSLLYFCR